MKDIDLLPVIGFALALIAIILILRLNKEAKKVREESLRKKNKSVNSVELYDALQDVMPEYGIYVIISLVQNSENANLKVVRLIQELKSFKNEQGILELRKVDSLREELDVLQLKDLKDIDEVLDLFIEKVQELKESKNSRNNNDDNSLLLE